MQMHTLLTRQQAGLWAASLAIGLCLSLLCSWSCTQLHTGAALCADTLRLHVRADADTLLAQTLKLKVRDAVLESFQACPEQSQDAARRWAAQIWDASSSKSSLCWLKPGPPARCRCSW